MLLKPCQLVCFFILVSSFLFTDAKSQNILPYDILISEVMANPDPSNGVTPVEYIELYNRSTKILNLYNCVLFNGKSTTTLPKYVLKPNAYVVIYGFISGLNYTSFGRDTLPVQKLIAINNVTDTLTFISADGKIIDAMGFVKDTYGDSHKSQGGFSLERANLFNPCARNSFIATENVLGGTPGAINSIIDSSSKTIQIQDAFFTDDKTLKINFTESVDSASGVTAERYSISPSLKIKNILLNLPLRDAVLLKFDSAVDKSKVYQCIIKSELKDCANHLMLKADTISVAFGKSPEVGDIIINEILFDPESYGARFIELYNRSAFPLSLNGLKIGDIERNDIVFINSTANILSNGYLVLTPKPDFTIKRYGVKASDAKYVLKNTLPTWYYKYGNASLFKEEGASKIIFDSVNYSTAMHNALLANVSGVSLERINPDALTSDRNNWLSAAAAYYGTPGKKNSQFRELNSLMPENTQFFFEKDIFSPDGDGYDDILRLNYQNLNVGDVVSINVYDIQGGLIKTLVQNYNVGESGFLNWEGDTNTGARAVSGFYWLRIEINNFKRGSQIFKKVCTLYNKF